jgi:hypothetical protein
MLHFLLAHRGATAESIAIAVVLALGYCLLPRTSRWLYTVERGLGWLACRRGLSIPLVGLLAFGASATLSLLGHMPEPRIHDEFSYLLAADTFAHGRLSNPTHPMWVHFESFHIIHQPTYASKYPPAQGLMLTVGQVIGGHPIVGVWISMGLACAATYWMLLGWLPAWWALLGTLLAILHPGILHWWGWSYWGGTVAMMGGALVFGASRRIVRRPCGRDALLLGVGLAVLANSRPYEGLVVSLPVAVLLLAWMLGKKGPTARVAIERIVLPIFVVIAVTGGAMGFYDWRVTGNALRMPYAVHEETYGVAPVFLWQYPRPVPAYRHTALRDFNIQQFNWYKKQQSISGLLRVSKGKVETLWLFYQGGRLRPLLTIPLVMLLWTVRDRWSRFALVTCGVLFAGLLAETWVWPHYAAPIVALVLVLILQGLRHLRLWRWHRRPVGQLVVGTLVLLVLASFLVGFMRRTREQPAGWAFNRACILAQLKAEKASHLVIMRYGPSHSPHQEWVFNAADIDGSKVVWAREMDRIQNQRLLEYFKDRQVWLIEIDDDRIPPKLVPYPRESRP